MSHNNLFTWCLTIAVQIHQRLSCVVLIVLIAHFWDLLMQMTSTELRWIPLRDMVHFLLSLVLEVCTVTCWIMFSFDWVDRPRLPFGPSDATVSETEKRVRCDRRKRGGRRCSFFFLVILVFTPVIWTPVVCKGRLFFKEGKMCAQLDTFTGELLPGLERSHFYLMLMFYYLFYFIVLQVHLWGWLMLLTVLYSYCVNILPFAPVPHQLTVLFVFVTAATPSIRMCGRNKAICLFLYTLRCASHEKTKNNLKHWSQI